MSARPVDAPALAQYVADLADGRASANRVDDSWHQLDPRRRRVVGVRRRGITQCSERGTNGRLVSTRPYFAKARDLALFERGIVGRRNDGHYIAVGESVHADDHRLT